MSERRGSQIEGGNDRRVIPRVSDSRIHFSFRQIRYCLLIIGVLLLSVALSKLYQGVVKGPGEIAKALFESAFFIGLGVAILQYSRAIKIYLGSESKNALERAIEQQFTFWLTLTPILVLYFIIQAFY